MEATIHNLPKTGRVEISVNVSAEMNFSAYAARKRVGRYIADEISMFLRSGEPTLAVSERLYWRVPVLLSIPGQGVLGETGAIDVDVETGQLRLTSALIEEIKKRAEHLATPPTPLAR